ncbi:hypothetical protein AB0C84_20365 [Actinomadura sp. NPDC048955]|uniref:Cas10/Cmr2 second palm domain-containing protein n=1 Tax=Actinomadura sp. NPDC048955 TaxID=3158228 RepID=UPI00340B70D3
MPTYLDVAAVRIQHYIARTPALRLRRGASWLLSTATSSDSVLEYFTGTGLGIARNRDAGDADGIIALTVDRHAERQAAEHVMLYLRELLPAVELQAVWATADSYLDAYPALAAQRSCPLVSMPPQADFSLGTTCEECRVDLRIAGGAMCEDCLARDRGAGRRDFGVDKAQDGSEDASAIERAVLDSVNKRRSVHLRPVRHFEELARLGSVQGNRNHVATVALDGNGMGAFFTALAHTGNAELNRYISPAISAATREALTAATAGAIRPNDRTLPVIAHVSGGDDVVVSVVADRAWTFVDGFQRAFTNELKKVQLPTDVRVEMPSMSAGVVFAHQKFPYARAVRLADDMLRKAKHDTQGAQAAVCWLDVTEDGEQAPTWRRAFTRDELDGHADAVKAIADLGNTGRQTLQRLLSTGPEEEIIAAVVSWARRNGHTEIRRLSGHLDIDDMRGLAAYTRWWRP